MTSEPEMGVRPGPEKIAVIEEFLTKIEFFFQHMLAKK